MALRAFYFIRALIKALTYYYINRIFWPLLKTTDSESLLSQLCHIFLASFPIEVLPIAFFASFRPPKNNPQKIKESLSESLYFRETVVNKQNIISFGNRYKANKETEKYHHSCNRRMFKVEHYMLAIKNPFPLKALQK